MFLTDHLLHLIEKETISYFEEMRKIRRELHAHPEISGAEAWTSEYLAIVLKNLGLKVHKMDKGYGLFADLITNPALPTIAFRADIDALPIHEVNNVSYRSIIPGIMHACGHDVHSAIGAGIAAVLTRISDQLKGNVRIIFQPEEEEISGALHMIHEGVLKNPQPKAIFGLHVAPLPAGKIAWADDLFLAGFDHYLVTLIPKENANISPGQLNRIAQHCCQLIQDFNQWHLPRTWREMQSLWEYLENPPNSLRNFVVYDASLDEENPDSWYGQFGIGVKAAKPSLRRSALGRIRATLSRISKLLKVNYHVEPMGSMIDMCNDAHLVQTSFPVLASAVGEENLIHLKAAFPFNCEDFAYYTKKVPGAMFWLGAANPDERKYALLHTPDFDVDESCMVTGTIAMVSIIIEASNIDFKIGA